MDYPEILSQTADGQTLKLELDIRPDLDAFEGHFDQFPIVPGVVQVGWSLHFFKKLLAKQAQVSTTVSIKKMSALKFQHVMTPNTPVELELTHDPDKQLLSFRFFNQEHQFSSGKIQLDNAPNLTQHDS